MPRLTLIGTGHVFRIEDAVRDAIVALRPECVFIELDRGRLMALQQRRRGIEPPARGGFVQRRLQRFQESVAGLYGGDVGAEMLAAVDGARIVGARVALIDRPADVTVRRALKALTWRERMRAVGLMTGGAFRALLPTTRARAKESVEEEIQRYQDDPGAALDELASKFPSVKRVVIDERDDLMAARVNKAMEQFESGVVVVGDGHIDGMVRQLGALQLTVHRLPVVRAGALPKPSPSDGFAGFSTQWDPPQPL